MKILSNRILVSRIEEEPKEGFNTVEVQDSFVYKGQIVDSGELHFKTSAESEYWQKNAERGSILLFAKYSPDTQEVDVDGKKMKIIKLEDVLAIL